MFSSHTRAKINMVRPPAPPVLIHALSSVSRHPVRSDSVCIVESRTGAVAWALCGNAPFPVPAHQTGRADFPHPAFRLASPRSTRRRAEMNAAQPKHAKFTKHHLVAEAAGAARQHLMAPNQEAPDALGNVVVDRPIGDQARAIAKVSAPAAQQAVQPIAHRRPWRLIAGSEDLPDPGLEPLDTLLRRARAQIPMTILAEAMRSERVVKEVEALVSAISNRGLRLVERQSELRHHRPRPRQGLGACPRLRMTKSSA